MVALAVLGVLLSIPLVFVLSSVFNGYVLSVLWGWFIVPTFGLPALGVVPAIGISMVVRYLTWQLPADVEEKKRSDREKIFRSLAFLILYPLIVLLCGWIAHLFM